MIVKSPVCWNLYRQNKYPQGSLAPLTAVPKRKVLGYRRTPQSGDSLTKDQR